MKPRDLLSVILLLLVSTACNRGSVGIPEEFDYGKVENGVYTNPFFDIRLKLPTDWDLRSADDAKRLMNAGMDQMEGSSLRKEAIKKSAEINTAQLVTLFRYTDAEGVSKGGNPSFVLMAENTSRSGLVETGADYLDILKKQLPQLRMNIRVEGEMASKEIAGMEFFHLNAAGDAMGISFHQRYYATVKNGFSLVFIITWINDGEEEELMKIVNSMEAL